MSKDILGRSESNIVNTTVNKLKKVVREHKIPTWNELLENDKKAKRNKAYTKLRNAWNKYHERKDPEVLVKP